MHELARSDTLLSQRSFAHRETVLSQHNCEYACSEYACSEYACSEYACSEASSALVAKSGEYSKLQPHLKRRCDHCRSFHPFEWVKASIHSQFFFFPPKQVDGPS